MSTSNVPTLAIGVLTMQGEEDDTRRVIATLSVVKSDHDAIYVHCNGFPHDTRTADFVRDLRSWGAEVSVSADNLGDVGGRNQLTRLSGFVDHTAGVFLDNDIVVPTTVLDTFRRAVATSCSPDRLGGVAIPAFSYRRLIERTPEAFTTVRTPDGQELEAFDQERFRVINSQRKKPIVPSVAGANPDWTISYLSALPYIARAFKIRDRALRRTVQSYHDYDELAARGQPVRASALPGGVCAIAMTHLRSGQPFDEIFRPFGSGDTSFFIGLHEQGYENYVIVDGAIPHGTHVRHDQRRAPTRQLADQVNRARGRTLLAARHDPGSRPALAAMRKVIGDEVLRAARGGHPSGHAVWAGLVGGVIAERQLEAEAPVDWTVDVPVGIAALDPSRFAGPPFAALDELGSFISDWRRLGPLLDEPAQVHDAVDEVITRLLDRRSDVLAAQSAHLIAAAEASAT